MSRYQKGKTSLDFTGARDSEWQWHQLGRMQVCTSLQTDNHTSTPPLRSNLLRSGGVLVRLCMCLERGPSKQENSYKSTTTLNNHNVQWLRPQLQGDKGPQCFTSSEIHFNI